MDESVSIAADRAGRTAAAVRAFFDRAFWCRVSLAIAAVVLCMQFEWNTLRFLTSEAAMRLNRLVGLPIQRLAFDELKFRGTIIKFTVACTWITGLFGIVPLLRMYGSCFRAKVRRIALFVAGFFSLNLIRIEIVILLYRPGVSWDLEHGWITGLSEFLVYLWVIGLIDHPLARFLRSGKLPDAATTYTATALSPTSGRHRR